VIPTPVAALPIHARPRTGESVESYIRRLARANHLRPSYLHEYLCTPSGKAGAIQPERLAAVSGRPLHILQRALPGLRPAPAKPSATRPGKPPAAIYAEKLRLYAAIRRDADTGYSIRALAARHYTHRRTVRQALAAAAPPPRKTPRRRTQALDHVRDQIDALIGEELTILEIWQRLFDDHDTAVSYATTRTYIVRRRKEITPDAHR
jgi:TniQ protein